MKANKLKSLLRSTHTVKQKWMKPQLVVLLRADMSDEMVLSGCKESGNNIGSSGYYSSCRQQDPGPCAYYCAAYGAS